MTSPFNVGSRPMEPLQRPDDPDTPSSSSLPSAPSRASSLPVGMPATGRRPPPGDGPPPRALEALVSPTPLAGTPSVGRWLGDVFSGLGLGPAAPHPTGLPGPPRAPSLSREQQALVGVARWPDPAYNNENDEGQKQYGQAFFTATRRAGQDIAEGKTRSLEGLWVRAGDWRLLMGSEGMSGSQFGPQRRATTPMNNYSAREGHPTMMVTPLTFKYEYIRDRFADRTDGIVVPSRFFPAAYPDSLRFVLTDQLFGTPIQLTTTVLSTDPGVDRMHPRYINMRDHHMQDLGEPFHLIHTNPLEVPNIMAHAETLFSQAIDPKLSNGEALNVIADLHWWLANAMPDERGSAAKSEWCIRAIAEARGMDLPPFQRGFVPDLEAMTMPRETFKALYPAKLEWKSARVTVG